MNENLKVMAARCIKYHYENDFITPLIPADLIKAIMEKYKMLNELIWIAYLLSNTMNGENSIFLSKHWYT